MTVKHATTDRQLIGVAEAAAFLRVHPATIRAMIARGELIAYRVGSGSVIRLDPVDVAAALHPVVAALPASYATEG